MSAPQKSSMKTPIKKLGIIAGGGSLPERLLHACDKKNIDVFLVALKNQTDPKILEGRQFMLTRIGKAGQIIQTLQAHHIKDIVLIGSIRRPSLLELKPDLKTATFFARVGMKALGDDGLLKSIRSELEHEGFIIHSIQEFADDLLAGTGPIGRYKPTRKDWPSIDRGIEAARQLGTLDIGQAVIVQEGIVLGVEGVEGTDELINRCGSYKRKGRGGILVKLSKPEQDKALDLPTIGPETIKLCAASGLSGIIFEAEKSLLINPQEVANLANKHKIFVTGLNTEELEDRFKYAA